MINMRTLLPALQKARAVQLAAAGLSFDTVVLPRQLRETRIVKDRSAEEIAREIIDWISK